MFFVIQIEYQSWSDIKSDNIKDLENIFSSLESNLVEDWKEEDLLVEILLAEGFPLDSIFEEIKDFTKNKVKQIFSDFSEHKLFICLDKKVHSETIKNLKFNDTDIFICLDNAITDEEKVTLSDKGLIKTI